MRLIERPLSPGFIIPDLTGSFFTFYPLAVMQWIKSGGIFNVWNVSSVQNGYFEFRKAGDGAVELVLSCSSWNAALTLEPVPHVRLSCAYFQMTEKGGEDEAADQKRTAEFLSL